MLRGMDPLMVSWLLSWGLLCPPLARGVCRSLQSGKHVWMDCKLSLWDSPFLFYSWGSMAIEWLCCGSLANSALTFWRTKYCCCYGEKSRDSLASVFTQTANNNSAVQSISSVHLPLNTFPLGLIGRCQLCLPDRCLRLPDMVWSAVTERAAPLGWGSRVSPSPSPLELKIFDKNAGAAAMGRQLCPSLVSHSYLPAASALFISLASWRKRNNT